MDHIGILKRVWHMLWRYRALWVFGIILALTVSSGGGSNSGAQFGGGGTDGGNGGQGWDFEPPSEFEQEMERLEEALERFFETGNWGLIPVYFSALIIGLCCLTVILAVLGVIARHVAEVALIRMVDEYEVTGNKMTVREGFRAGWSRAAWRTFLIGLVVTLPIVIGGILLLTLTALPLFLWATRSNALGIFGTFVTIGLFFLALLVIFVVGTVARVVVRLAWRAASLENLGVFEALARSWALIKSNWKDVGLMWLIMLGVNLGYGILTIPVVLVLLVIAIVAGGLVFGALWALVRVFAAGALPWIVGGALAAPVFLALLILPLTFLEGLRQVYQSGVWTLTFRELVALGTLAEQKPLVAPSVEALEDGDGDDELEEVDLDDEEWVDEEGPDLR